MPTPPAAPWTSSRSPTAQAGLGEERVVGGGEDLGDAARGVPVELLRAPASPCARGRPRARPGRRRRRSPSRGRRARSAARRGRTRRPRPPARARGCPAARRAAPGSGPSSCSMSAPLRPGGRGRGRAARQSPGLGIGVLLDGDRAVADGGGAHAARCYLRRGVEPSDRPGTLVAVQEFVPIVSRVRTARQYVPHACNPADSARSGGSRASASRPPRCCAARSGAALGVPPGERPPGAADPGLHGRRRLARRRCRAGCGGRAIAPTARASAPTSPARRRRARGSRRGSSTWPSATASA